MEALPAIRQLIGEGINVNITLLFSIARYAIANAKLAYQRYLALCRTASWQALAAAGAHPQRLLWASTSTKNARYRDVRYVVANEVSSRR